MRDKQFHSCREESGVHALSVTCPMGRAARDIHIGGSDEGDDHDVLGKLMYQATDVLEQARMTHTFMNLSVSR